MIRAILFTLAVVAVLLAANRAQSRGPSVVTSPGAAPRNGADGGVVRPITAVPSEAPSSGNRAATASPSVLAAAEGLPSPATLSDEPPAVFGGAATWYCSRTSACTRGYGPSDYIAAVDRSTGIRRGDRIRVRYGGRSVVVTVVDSCACAGVRVIDLSRIAFARLADPGLGIIPVAVEWLR